MSRSSNNMSTSKKDLKELWGEKDLEGVGFGTDKEYAFERQNHYDDCKVSFLPKRMSSDVLVADNKAGRKSVWKCFKRTDILSSELVDSYLARIARHCLTFNVDSYRIHLDRLKGMKLIRKVARRINYNDLTLTQIVYLIWSSMSTVHHFYIRLVSYNVGYREFKKRVKEYNYALASYAKVLYVLLPPMFTPVVQSIITFFNESKTWSMDSLLAIFLIKLLEVYSDNDHVGLHLLSIVQRTESHSDAIDVLRVLQRLLFHIEMTCIEGSFIDQLLNCFKDSACNIELEHLRSGYEACLRHAFKKMKRTDVLRAINRMLEWVASMDESAVIEFGNLLEHAAKLHDKNESYCTSITSTTLEKVLELISSEYRYINILGNRIFYNMFENENNAVTLLTPRFFFQDMDGHLNVGQYKLENKMFLKEHHKIIHASLMGSIYKHCNSSVNLECTFANIAVMAVEVPCGYTAAASVCLAMAVQEYTLADSSITIDNFYRVQACVMFIMSLICHVHKAKILYEYVNSILSRRAEMAPELNPPLCLTYRNYPSSVTRADLYFEDWEVRFGLWKCFIKISTD